MSIDVRMNNNEAFITTSLCQYRKLPIARKLSYVMQMRPKYRAIGMMLTGLDDDFVRNASPKEYVDAADMLLKWAKTNRESSRKRSKK